MDADGEDGGPRQVGELAEDRDEVGGGADRVEREGEDEALPLPLGHERLGDLERGGAGARLVEKLLPRGGVGELADDGVHDGLNPRTARAGGEREDDAGGEHGERRDEPEEEEGEEEGEADGDCFRWGVGVGGKQEREGV